MTKNSIVCQTEYIQTSCVFRRSTHTHTIRTLNLYGCALQCSAVSAHNKTQLQSEANKRTKKPLQYVKTKEQSGFFSRVRTIRFICELSKLGIHVLN